MNSEAQTALEALAGRALTADEIALADARNDMALAASLSANRIKVMPHRVSELGVRAALSVVDAFAVLSLFRTLRAATALPDDIAAVLHVMGVPDAALPAYLDTLQAAAEWLHTPEGLDIGSTAARQMMDLIADARPSLAASMRTLKSLAEIADPIDVHTVSDVLNAHEPPPAPIGNADGLPVME